MPVISITGQRVIYGILSFVMFVLTFSLCSYTYTCIGTQKWELISTIQLRTIDMINAVCSSMVFLLGFVSVMKFQKTWQIIYCFFLLVPIIFCAIQLGFVTHYKNSANWIFETLEKSQVFLDDQATIVSEFSQLSKEAGNESCGSCSLSNFMCCVEYAQKYSEDFRSKSLICASVLLCAFFVTLFANVLLLFCTIEDTSYQAAA